MTEVVLDASAVLAFLYEEQGMDRVAEVMTGALISSINAAEVVTVLIRSGIDVSSATLRVKALPCVIVAVDEDLGLRAGELFQATRHKGCSLGDRVCLALAEREGLAVITTDRAWKDLDLGVEITLIR
jgi:ribonuclease VapC